MKPPRCLWWLRSTRSRTRHTYRLFSCSGTCSEILQLMVLHPQALPKRASHLSTRGTPGNPLSTPSPDPATFSTSLTPPSRLRIWALHLHTTVVRTLATPHLQGECTSWEDAPGLHTETPRTARVQVSEFRSIRQRRESFSHVRTSKCGEGRRDLPEMSRSSSDQLD